MCAEGRISSGCSPLGFFMPDTGADAQLGGCHLVRRSDLQNVVLGTETVLKTDKTALTRRNLSHHSRYEYLWEGI